MALGPFLTHDSGYKSLLGSGDWVTDSHYAVLSTTAELPDQASQVNYSDIIAECTDEDYARVAITGKVVDLNATKVRFTCGKISFGNNVTISARYLFILNGIAMAPDGEDEIIGHIDLTGADDVSSVFAEFSLTPDLTNGLFEVARSSAP